ncbi:DUF3995 domain-containing protein [Streptomyces sp. TR06-5]|uniref:DUF3995 domain-containing protein n=1 Tax=unclassified Streptomyces TaxID=2593676 RepID=UPI00399F321A
MHSAFVFTLAFTALHVYWAVGGTWGLPLLALHNAEAVRTVNWAVSALMLIGAFVVLGLNRPVARKVPSWMLLVPIWAGTVVCVSHALYGFVTKGLYLSGQQNAVDFPVVPGVDPATAAEKNHLSALHDLLVFEPAFLIQGVLLALAGLQFLTTAAGRRRWSVSLIVGVLAIDAFGVALALAGLRFAVN